MYEVPQPQQSALFFYLKKNMLKKLPFVFSTVSQLISAQNIPDIAWGFASSAYQVEGAWNVDGKGPSVWDKWFENGAHSLVRSPDVTQTAAGSPFNTTDHYHRMKEDVGIMRDLGATIYRFSVSWPRIFPNCNGQVNQAGINFYSNLIDELLASGIHPVLTMYHWDTPQACEDQYGSWSSDRIIADFTSYADVLFQNFGSRVKIWLTINEPGAYCGRAFAPQDAYVWPPGKNGPIQAKYDCVGRMTLAHASVVNLARSKYSNQNMKFGVPHIITYYIPVDTVDVESANQRTLSQADWIWAPLVTGDYPEYLSTIRNDDMNGIYLPKFTDAQKSSMRGTLDYIALNYYSASYYNEISKKTPPNDLVRPPNGISWQNVYPRGIRVLSQLLSNYYGGLGMSSRNGMAEIMISECGYGSTSEAFEESIQSRVNDVDRQTFFAGITDSLRDAIVVDKTPITSFTAWALLDNLE